MSKLIEMSDKELASVQQKLQLKVMPYINILMKNTKKHNFKEVFAWPSLILHTSPRKDVHIMPLTDHVAALRTFFKIR